MKSEYDNPVRIPEHIAFIMDGNGRWAKKRGMERTEGHARGAEVAESVVRICADYGIKYVTLFAFSTENWSRPTDEVKFLFKTLVYYLESRSGEMISKGVRIRFNGDISSLDQETRALAEKIEKDSIHCDKIHMILAVNYGGRREIWEGAVKLSRIAQSDRERYESILKSGEDAFKSLLYLPDVPDPDFVVRTSGEERLSNFLLWQLAYSELYFPEVLWPDFDETEFVRALNVFSVRKRRFGGVDTIGK